MAATYGILSTMAESNADPHKIVNAEAAGCPCVNNSSCAASIRITPTLTSADENEEADEEKNGLPFHFGQKGQLVTVVLVARPPDQHKHAGA